VDVLRAVRPRAGDRRRAFLARRHRDGRDFLVGDALRLADIALYAHTHVAHEGGFELDAYPAVRAWLERVAAASGHVPIDA
jgi:glutathione S-transferase